MPHGTPDTPPSNSSTRSTDSGPSVEMPRSIVAHAAFRSEYDLWSPDNSMNASSSGDPYDSGIVDDFPFDLPSESSRLSMPSTSTTSSTSRLAGATMLDVVPASDKGTSWYYGLPSPAICLASSRPNLILPSVDDGRWRVPARLLPPRTSDALQKAWRRIIVPSVLDAAGVIGVSVLTVDLIRISRPKSSLSHDIQTADELASNTIWIGIEHEKTSRSDLAQLISICLDQLRVFGLSDIEVDVKYTGGPGELSGKPFLSPDALNPDPDVRSVQLPFTPRLGMSIARQNAGAVRGTLGLFLRLPSQNSESQLFGLTAQHCASDDQNSCRRLGETAPGESIILLSDYVFAEKLEEVEAERMKQGRRMRVASKNSEKPGPQVERQIRQSETHMQNMEDLKEFATLLKSEWDDAEERILGVVACHPSIGLISKGYGTIRSRIDTTQPGGFTEDWAMIQLDESRLAPASYENVVDLGDKLPTGFLGSGPGDETILRVSGTMPIQESIPTSGSPSTTSVFKYGAKTGLTFGRLSPLVSARRVKENANGVQSKPIYSWELPIFGYDPSQPFSLAGDSGASVIDGTGRFVGLIHRGDPAKGARSDITYATPAEFILDRIEGFCGNRPSF